MADILEDPHLQASGFFRRREHPSEGGVIEMTPPIRYERYLPDMPRPAPRTDEHGEEIHRELSDGRPDNYGATD
jgi:crotonobetainyl-CoA:carnitine CoA-transferase CaiB-like acyl-CoA transferase